MPISLLIASDLPPRRTPVGGSRACSGGTGEGVEGIGGSLARRVARRTRGSAAAEYAITCAVGVACVAAFSTAGGEIGEGVMRSACHVYRAANPDAVCAFDDEEQREAQQDARDDYLPRYGDYIDGAGRSTFAQKPETADEKLDPNLAAIVAGMNGVRPIEGTQVAALGPSQTMTDAGGAPAPDTARNIAALGGRYMSPERFAEVDAELQGYDLDIGEALESAETWVTTELQDPQIRDIVRRDIGRAIDDAVRSFDTSPIPSTSEDSDPVFVVSERMSAAIDLGPTLMTAKAMDLARADAGFLEQIERGQWLPIGSFNEAASLFFHPDRDFYRHPLFLGQGQGGISVTHLLQQYDAHPEFAAFSGGRPGPLYLTDAEMPFSVQFLSVEDQELAVESTWTYLKTMAPHLAPYAGGVAGFATDVGDLSMDGDAHLAALKAANLVDGRFEMDTGVFENVVAAASLITVPFGMNAIPKGIKLGKIAAKLDDLQPGLGQRFLTEVDAQGVVADGATNRGAQTLADDVDVQCANRVCKPGEKKCFAAGTLVDTAEGLRPIETIEVGDLVVSRESTSAASVLRKVTRTFVTPKQTIVRVELSDPSGDSRDVMRTTREHPFYVAGRGWVRAGDLHLGEQVSTSAEAWTVVALATEAERTTVYNFEVDELHTYFVGRSGTWVHNLCSEQRERRLAKIAAERDKRTQSRRAQWAARGDPAIQHGMDYESVDSEVLRYYRPPEPEVNRAEWESWSLAERDVYARNRPEGSPELVREPDAPEDFAETLFLDGTAWEMRGFAPVSTQADHARRRESLPGDGWAHTHSSVTLPRDASLRAAAVEFMAESAAYQSDYYVLRFWASNPRNIVHSGFGPWSVADLREAENLADVSDNPGWHGIKMKPVALRSGSKYGDPSLIGYEHRVEVDETRFFVEASVSDLEGFTYESNIHRYRWPGRPRHTLRDDLDPQYRSLLDLAGTELAEKNVRRGSGGEPVGGDEALASFEADMQMRLLFPHADWTSHPAFSHHGPEFGEFMAQARDEYEEAVKRAIELLQSREITVAQFSNRVHRALGVWAQNTRLADFGQWEHLDTGRTNIADYDRAQDQAGKHLARADRLAQRETLRNAAQRNEPVPGTERNGVRLDSGEDFPWTDSFALSDAPETQTLYRFSTPEEAQAFVRNADVMIDSFVENGHSAEDLDAVIDSSSDGSAVVLRLPTDVREAMELEWLREYSR